MGVRDDMLSTIKDKQAMIEELEKNLQTSKTAADRTSRQMEINRQKQEIANLRFHWQSLNPGKRIG
jgi:hypothetical protein